MFSPTPPSKSHIQEANKHLQLLHVKIQDLETQLAEKEVLFGEREKQLSDALEFTTHSKDSEIAELKKEIGRKNSELLTLNARLKEQDSTIARLQHRCAVLDYIAKHKNVLEEIVSVLSGVQRLDQKAQLGREDSRTSHGREVFEFSKKTEAHGISEAHSPGTASQDCFKVYDNRFSITELEEDDDDDKITSDVQDEVFLRQQSNREHYL